VQLFWRFDLAFPFLFSFFSFLYFFFYSFFFYAVGLENVVPHGPARWHCVLNRVIEFIVMYSIQRSPFVRIIQLPRVRNHLFTLNEPGSPLILAKTCVRPLDRRRLSSLHAAYACSACPKPAACRGQLTPQGRQLM
jgi:hypothetical protein